MAGRRCELPYLRIDPLKVDVGRVADVMSMQLRRAPPRAAGAASARRGDDRHLRALRHRLGGRDRGAHAHAA